jgi:hypothetical protein
MHTVPSNKFPFKTGNARGGQASGTSNIMERPLTGHCYTGIDYYMKASAAGEPPRIRTTLLEGTKWVKPMFATNNTKTKSKIFRNACLDCPTLQNVNQLSALLMELTKIPSVNPTMDLGCSELQILQGDISYGCMKNICSTLLLHFAQEMN